MFNFLKRKTKREKLIDQYKKLKEKAFKSSKINRKESDRLEFEANEILKQIDILDK